MSLTETHTQFSGADITTSFGATIKGITWSMRRLGPAPIYTDPKVPEAMILVGSLIFSEDQDDIPETFDIDVTFDNTYGQVRYKTLKAVVLDSTSAKADSVHQFRCEDGE